jgi:general secretion pathway protein N
MSPSGALLALAVVLVAERCFGAERDRTPVTAALENAPVLSEPDMSSTPPQPDPTSAPTPGPATAPGNPLWSIPLRALSATRERPLFSPSRRPPAPIIAAAPAPVVPRMPIAVKPAEPERPPLALVGTVVSPGKRVAILFNSMTRRVTQVLEGGEESGWRVRLVSPRSIVLEKDDRSVTLDLPKPGEQPAAGMPAISQ